jgi:hypothetical protein
LISLGHGFLALKIKAMINNVQRNKASAWKQFPSILRPTIMKLVWGEVITKRRVHLKSLELHEGEEHCKGLDFLLGR